MENHSKADTRKGGAPKEKRAALAESEEESEQLSPINIGSEAPLPSEFEFPDALELRKIESDTQNRLKAILEVAGVTGLSQIDARTFQDPEILRKLTNSVSSALDEAATALTRMKSDRQTYEAFLRGANQAPSPSPLHPSAGGAAIAPHGQQQQHQHHHPASASAGGPPQQANNSGEKMTGNVTLKRSQHQPLPQQQQQGGVPHPSQSSHQGTGGHQDHGGRSQSHHHHAHHHAPQQQQQGQGASPAVSTTPPTNPNDSMQTVQRLLTQGHSIQEASEDGESLLSLACSAGYYELAEVLLRMRASVEDRGIKGDSTPLMEAASGGYADIVKLLIDHGANVNAKSSVGNTALTYACCGGYEDVVKILLDAGADVEHQNENGHTPLMEAASCGHVGVAKLLLQYGANINTHSNEFKESALTLACYKGHLEMVKFLLSAGADQEHKTDEMHTALMEASMDGHVDVARLLLDHGAQVNMPVDSFESPLTLAACGGHYELAALLISRGADLEEVNDEGYTPLMEAAREGHEDVVQLLVEHGANVNAQTEETQETALTLACCGGFMEVVQYLIEHGADIELGASTPLMEASQEGHVNIVKFLLERGAKVHAETSTGDTALTYACANGHTLIASILLQCGAELEHESEGGRTPLMKAARAGHLQTIQFLVTKGADVNRSTTNNDHTVLSLASAGGHVSVVQYLLIRGAEPSYCLRDGSTMLIEAARGGHTSVVNLLLRQPLMKRRQQLEQASAMAADSRKLAAMSAAVSGARNKHASSSSATSATPSNTATPAAVDGSANTSGGAAQANATTTTTSAASGGGGGNQTSGTGKTLSSTTTTTLQHISPPPPSSEELSQQQQQQVQDATSGGAPVVMVPATTTTSSAGSGDQQQPQKASLSVSTGSSGGGGGGSAPLQHPAKSKLAQKSGGKQQTQQQQQGNNGGREAGIYPQQQQQLPSDGGGGTDKGITSSLSSRKGAGGGGGSDLIGAKRPKMSSTTEPCPSSSSSLLAGMTPQQQQHISTLLATPTKMKMVDSDLPYVVTPPSTSAAASPGGVVSSAFSPGHYTTDSATALKNMQRLTSNANSPLKSGVMATSEVGTSVDVPPLLHSPQTHVVNSTHVNSNEVTLPSTQLTPDDIIQGHMTADDIVARYWQQQNISELSSSKHVVGESKANGARDEENAAQRMFSSGNFSTLPPHPVSSGQAAGYHHPSRFHASSSAMGIPPGATAEGGGGGGDPQSLLVNSLSTGEHSNNSVDSDAGTGITQAPSVDSHPLSNVDLTRLIPHLEALAGSLQNQSPLETHQYLAALAAQSSHLLHPPPVSTEDGNIDVPPDIGADENDVSLPPLDPAALFSAAEIAKLLPNLASLGAESQSDGAADFRTVATGAPSAVSVATTTTTATGLPYPSKYRPSMSTVRYMSRKFAGIAEMAGLTSADVGAGPDPGGGGGGVAMGAEEEGSEIDVDLLHQDPTRSLPPSLLLDNKFPLDIPPPSDLVPPENLLPTGYDGSLENESYPTSDEEEEPDEDESDSSYLAPHMSNLMPGFEPAIDIDQQTDSNHDTALTLAAAGGHDELVELLLNHGANIEHRDKKGCTPLILAASAGHAVTVAILLDHNADIEAQSDRTKDTALSLACSGGRQEVVELLLAKGANFEHRNVSDYTPLSLAASGGYVNIIKLLLRAGADINSRTGSKLGISPLMLAAMNGHTSTVKLLLDMGSDINAQIETNRNTALTLACFQGRHEVVNLLVERQANVEHRAKTGLTPLMEAASGGYYEVGKVLINKGADVNAAPVPSSKDTALTIAADKGHYKFVELILRHGANVDVKNKKGNSPLWLAANGGHLDVIRLLIEHSADVDSQDNRKVSCLMAAFRRGHFKVVKFLVDHVSQFPSDSELTRYIGTLSDKELLKKTQRCMEVIIDAKERQAAEANKNATILLQEIDLEKKHEEDRRAAAARKREKKKRKKEKKKAQKEAESEKGNGATGGDTPPEYEAEGNGGGGGEPSQLAAGGADEGDDDVIETTEPVPKIPEPPDRTEATKSNKKQDHQQNTRRHEQNRANKATELRDENQPPPNNRASSLGSENQVKNASKDGEKPQGEGPGTRPIKKTRSRAGSERSSSGNIASSKGGSGSQLDSAVPSSSPRKGKREEGWKEVGRRTKKVSIPGILFPQIVGKNSCNLAAIRQATSTQIDIDRHGKQSSNRTITVRGSADAIKQVHHLISVLIQDPNQDIHQLLTKFAGASSSSSSSAAASSSSAHRRHVTSSSHDPTPSVPPLETFEVASDAQPAKANPTATSASAAAAPTSTTVGTVLRSNYRKSGSVSSISTISSSLPPSSSSVSGKPSASLTQSLGGSFNVRVSAQGLATVSGDNKSHHHHHQGTSSLLDSHHHISGGGGGGDPSIHSVAAPPISTRVPTSGSISVNVKPSSHQHSQQQAIGSGPVRRLFTSGPSSHQPPAQLISTPAAAPSSASVANPTRSTATTATSGSAVSLVRTASGHTIPTGKVSVAPPVPGSGRAHPASLASKLSSSRPHEVSAGTSKQSVTYPVLLTGSEKQQLSAPPPSHVVKSQVTIGGPPTAASGAAVSMSYSRVINAAAISAVQDSSTQSQAQQSQSQQQQMLGGEVIEQPLQQIMKTPMIFQDPATQLAKAKKKSTYSDAVGKKSGVSSVVGANVAISGAPSGMVGMATVVPSSAVAVSSSGTAGVLQTAPPVSSQQIMTSAQQHKINLAPGSRPTTEMNPQLSGVGVGVMDKQRSRAAPWSEVTAGGGGGTVPSGSDKAHHPAVAAAPTATGVYEDVEHEGGVASSERGAHLPHLGPIGPPSKSIKTGQSGFISGPSSAGKQSSSSSGRSFSPAGSRPKTSPTALNTSPHRNEHSPAAKSPLLGTAPPGLLPPPDKGGGVYSTAFRPIQQHPEGDSSSNIPTLVPTPLRNSRPPLLETPPGFRIMSQGIRQQKPSSPVPSPEKSSPNKSPPVQAIKGFNPNAPTFVPMALQNQRPTNPPTSSILGAPPTPKFPVFGPSGGASILGSAPQLPPGPTSMYGGGGNQQPRMMSPAPPFSNQPGPPPPPPPQMVQTAAFIQQQPPPPPPPQGGQHQVAPPPPGPPQPPQQQQPPLTQSSLLGQPPSAPMSHPVFGGSGGGPPPPPPAFQTIQTRPPGPPHPAAGQGGMPPHPPQTPLYGHQIEGAPPPLPPPPPGSVGGASGPPSAGLIQQQPPQGPTPFGINLVPFASGVDPPPIGTSGAQPHPGQPNSATGDVPKFGLQNLMYFKPNADGAVPSDSTQQSMMFATAGGSAVGPHFETVGGPPLPATPSGIISSRTPGPENLFNHLNLGQLGAMGGAETVPDESNQSPSFQSAGAGNGFPQYPSYLHQQQPNQEIPTPSSSLTSVGGGGGGGVIFTPSSNFIVMTPGVFTTATAGFTSTSGQPLTSQTGGGGAAEVGDGLLPIGTERAHKSSTLPAAFSMLAPGNVWSYSGNPSSEGSDWAKVGSKASDWPSAVPLPPSSAGTTSEPAAGHKLESVLEKLGFSEYLPLFQKNEIDLDALQLMSEKEFTEIGLPTSPTHKLLSALQQSSPQTSTSATAEEPSLDPPPPGGMARNTTSGSSTPPSEAAPVVSTPSKQHAASQ